MTNGIYTLANDVVHDQLVALLNSIEANAGEVPVCVIAYNDRLEKVRATLRDRPNVVLLDSPELFQDWEDFSYRVWQAHPTALQTWQQQGVQTRFYRVGENHRYCAFDDRAPFDKFVYLDCDTLVMGGLEFVFEQLDRSDFAVYDFQYKDPGHIFNIHSTKLLEIFPEHRLKTEIFCSGFYGSKRGTFPQPQREEIIQHLQSGEAEILYPKAPNQSLLNYMIMRTGKTVHNFALSRPSHQRAGNSVVSPHFQERDRILYDKEAQLTYLHYIGLSSKLFAALCSGENIDFPYRDLFLHYRYLHEPENRPRFTGKPKPYNPPPSLMQRIQRKFSLKM